MAQRKESEEVSADPSFSIQNPWLLRPAYAVSACTLSSRCPCIPARSCGEPRICQVPCKAVKTIVASDGTYCRHLLYASKGRKPPPMVLTQSTLSPSGQSISPQRDQPTLLAFTYCLLLFNIAVPFLFFGGVVLLHTRPVPRVRASDLINHFFLSSSGKYGCKYMFVGIILYSIRRTPGIE